MRPRPKNSAQTILLVCATVKDSDGTLPHLIANSPLKPLSLAWFGGGRMVEKRDG